jgi:hypothetical protein
MIKRATVQALVAVLLGGVLAGGCDDDPPAPKRDAAADARPADGGVDARDAASADTRLSDASTADAPATDAPAADAPATDAVQADAMDPAGDGPVADAPAADAPADALPADATVVDGASSDAGDGGSTQGTDGGIACAAGVSREMLCSNYCQGLSTICTGANAQFPSVQACLAACNAPTWACGMLGQTTGNTLFCRIGHLALAIAAAPAVECPNAGPTSAACQ